MDTLEQQLAAIADSRKNETLELSGDLSVTIRELSSTEFLKLQDISQENQKDVTRVMALTLIHSADELNDEHLELVMRFPRDVLEKAHKAIFLINGIDIEETDEKKPG